MERRRLPRKACSHPVSYTSGFRKHKGRILNLSKSGAFIQTTKKMPVGKSLKLIIPYTSGKRAALVTGEVVHNTAKGFGVGFVKANQSGTNED